MVLEGMEHLLLSRLGFLPFTYFGSLIACPCTNLAVIGFGFLPVVVDILILDAEIFCVLHPNGVGPINQMRVGPW